MRLVHLSDLHLGYRQYQRLTPTGINQREADVARSFQRAIDRIIALRPPPDVVLLAGDVFQTVRPSNPAILHAFAQLARLTSELPEANLVIVAGNHDTPRAAETGCILRLFERVSGRVYVADSEPRRIHFEDRDLSVLAVPDVIGAKPALTPDRNSRYNVLVLHGEVQGVLPRFVAEIDRAAVSVTREELDAERWSYVALGHYHVHRRVDTNAYYSGAIDYTGLHVWGEKWDEEELGLKGKGFIEFDLDAGEHRFHELPASREFVELPAISARGKSVPEIDAAIRRVVEKCKGGIDDKIVRLVISDMPRHVVRELDHRVLREYKRRALSFQLDTRKPESPRLQGQGAPGRRPSVVDVVREQLRSRALPADLDRERLVELGLKYLSDAEALAITSAAEPES